MQNERGHRKNNMKWTEGDMKNARRHGRNDISRTKGDIKEQYGAKKRYKTRKKVKKNDIEQKRANYSKIQQNIMIWSEIQW